MKPNIKFNNLKSYLIPMLSFVAVVVMVPVFIMPQLNQIAADSKVINDDKSKLDAINSKVGELQSLKNNETSLQTDLATTEKVLPISKALAPMVLGIQQIAINNRLAINKIHLQPGEVATTSAQPSSSQTNSTNSPATEPDLQTSPDTIIMNLEMSGSLDSLGNFLKVLEVGRRLLLLKTFKADENAENSYLVRISFTVPYSPLPTLSPDQLTSPLPAISQQDRQLLTKLANQLKDVTAAQIIPGPVGEVNPFK